MTDSATESTARTALVVSVLLVMSSALGLLRDLSLAGLFGASSETDAFLVAWTIPETMTVLLMDGAMSFLLVPVFVSQLTRRGTISRVVRATLLPMLLLLGLLTAAITVFAPVLVDLLAPGIQDRDLAILSFRLAASTVLFMGVNGYLMAALRANKQFVRPASSYVAYNIGILACMWGLHERFGVVGAALGLAVGSALMVVVQIGPFLRVTSLRGLVLRFDRRLWLAAGAFVPVAAYSLGRQAQIFVERIVASTLDPGSISSMNYASKVAQMASLLALTAASVAFPTLAKLASRRDEFRQRVMREARVLIVLIAPAIAFFFFFAEPSIRLLFQRGAFDAADTALTGDVMRIYCLGLMGQVFISLGAFVCYADQRGSRQPAYSVLVGLAATVVLDVTLAPVLGVVALAVGNAAGITVSAVLLWVRIRRHVISYSATSLLRLLSFALVTAGVSAGAAREIVPLFSTDTLIVVLMGGFITVAVFLLAAAAAGVPEARDLVRSASSTARTRGARARRRQR